MGILSIQGRVMVQHEEDFVLTVHVVGGAPYTHVLVRLAQTAGIDPLYRAAKPVALNGSGNAAATFDVRLAGPCIAVLTADDEAGLLIGDDHTVKVTP